MKYKIKFGVEYIRRFGSAPGKVFADYDSAYRFGIENFDLADYDRYIWGSFAGWVIVKV